MLIHFTRASKKAWLVRGNVRARMTQIGTYKDPEYHSIEKKRASRKAQRKDWAKEKTSRKIRAEENTSMTDTSVPISFHLVGIAAMVERLLSVHVQPSLVTAVGQVGWMQKYEPSGTEQYDYVPCYSSGCTFYDVRPKLTPTCLYLVAKWSGIPPDIKQNKRLVKS